MAMRHGERVTILLELCRGDQSRLGYYAADKIMWQSMPDGEYIATPFLHFTDHTGVPQYEYVQFQFFPENRVDVHVSFYEPKEMQRVGDFLWFGQRGFGLYRKILRMCA